MFTFDFGAIALIVSIVACAMAVGTLLAHLNRRKVERDVADWNSRPEVRNGDEPPAAV